MKLLVTGGSGVVGLAVVTALLRRGHSIRLLSRHALEDIEEWDERVEPWPASITDTGRILGSADGCDLVLHLAGIVAESPPASTLDAVNVEGTRNIVRETERAKVGRLIHMSSLGADRGTSAYHRSKRAGEEIVQQFHGGWIILRPGNVYGPGDDELSVLLQMVRTSPVIPVIDGGDDRFQPIWADDLAQAITRAVERPDLHGQILEVAGEEQTSMSDLLTRMAAVTGRHPMRVPLPGFLASAGAAIATAVGIPIPISESQLTMLKEGNVIHTPGANALTAVFRIKPTTLEEGLKKLADAQQEQLPEEGIGTLKRRRIWADISGSRLTPEELFESFRRDFNDATPGIVDASSEPGIRCELAQGATLTMSLPVRGNIQVRVQEITPRKATLVTLSGHPLAGAVRFLAEQRGSQVRFETQVYDRPASLPDWLAMRTAGDAVQARTWDGLVERMVRESGGTAPKGVEHEEEAMEDQQAERIEHWVRDLVMARRRDLALAPESEPRSSPATRGT